MTVELLLSLLYAVGAFVTLGFLLVRTERPNFGDAILAILWPGFWLVAIGATIGWRMRR